VDATLLGAPVIIWIGGALALYMAWAIGANDVANAMGTSVGSGALTIRGAILVAAVLEFGGAFLVGGHVTDTVRKGILDAAAFAGHEDLLMYGMLAALASAGTWLVIASRAGWPVSTTHSIVGAIVGFGAVGLGLEAIAWAKVGQIVASWVTSPLMSGVLAYGIFQVTRRLVLDHDRPIERIKALGPFFFGWVFFILGLVTLFKGLKNLKLDLDFGEAMLASAALAGVGALIGWALLRRVRTDVPEEPGGERFANVERIFAVLQIMTACAVAFAHGSNDVANSIGPLAALVNVAYGGEIGGKAPVALWMLGLGGVGIVIGLATYGYKVMETVGKKITELTPSRGFAAELAREASEPSTCGSWRPSRSPGSSLCPRGLRSRYSSSTSSRASSAPSRLTREEPGSAPARAGPSVAGAARNPRRRTCRSSPTCSDSPPSGRCSSTCASSLPARARCCLCSRRWRPATRQPSPRGAPPSRSSSTTPTTSRTRSAAISPSGC
jgi:PiT family inorganic phosphate transporter